MKPLRRILPSNIDFLILTSLVVLTLTFGWAANEEKPSANDRAELIGGTVDNGMTYHIRLPAGHDPETTQPAIVILHGSNMNSLAYVNTMASAWPDIASAYIVIGINGERRNKNSPEDNPTYNYTYVNFAGKSKYKGYPGTDRESPALIAEVIEQIKKEHKIGKIFIGGHSQGGFCTYSCFMNYPDLFAGAFPISGGLIIQAEPTAYDNAEIRAKQREGAMAIIHGETDQVVQFNMSESAYASFLDDGFPAVRLFNHNTAGHMFALLPVDRAIRWLERVTTDNPKALLEFADERLKAGAYREASAALIRLKRLDQSEAFDRDVRGIEAQIESAAAPAAKELTTAMALPKDDSWVEEYLQFRAQFEFSEPAKPLLKVYQDLREAHQEPAKKLWFEARREFGQKNNEPAYAKCEEIVAKYYASTYYRYAKNTLKNRE